MVAIQMTQFLAESGLCTHVPSEENPLCGSMLEKQGSDPTVSNILENVESCKGAL